jgi:hypothetical protein
MFEDQRLTDAVDPDLAANLRLPGIEGRPG